MITYVNSGNDAKRFNTFALAAKHSLIKKQLAINTQIDYLKSVYNRYVSHYNQLQKLIKEINDLTGESRYTKVDYSDFPAVDISASFSMKLSNIRLVPEGTSSLRFKNTIEDLRSNFSDLSLSIKSFYNRAMTELSPYGSMRQRTDNIHENSSKASTVVGMNINTALTEGDLSKEDWSNIKEHAEREKNEKEKTLKESEPTNPTNPTNPTAPSMEDLEREAREAAEAAAKDAFDKKQKDLEHAAIDALNKLNKVEKRLNGFGDSFFLSEYVNNHPGNTTYEDPLTGEIFAAKGSVQTYVDSYGAVTEVVYDGSTGKSTVKKNGEEVGTYDNQWEAQAAADEAAGQNVFSGEKGIIGAAQEAYNRTKQITIADKNAAQEEVKEAAEAAEAHRNSAPSSDSSGGT